MGVRVRTIRQAVGQALAKRGFVPAKARFSTIGRTKGARVHRSFATEVPSSSYEGRPRANETRSTLELHVRVLVVVPVDDPDAYIVDDIREQAISAVLYDTDTTTEAHCAIEVTRSSLTHVDGASLLTLVFRVLHTLFTHPEPSA